MSADDSVSPAQTDDRGSPTAPSDKPKVASETLEPFWLSEIECAKYFDFSSILSVPVVPDEETNPPLDDKAWESDDETRGFFHALTCDPQRKHPSRVQRLPPPPSDVRNSGAPVYRHRPTIPFEELVQKHTRQAATARATPASATSQQDPSKLRRSPSCVAPVRAPQNSNKQPSVGSSKELLARQSRGLNAATSFGKLPTNSVKSVDPPVRAKRIGMDNGAPPRSTGTRGHSSISSGGSSKGGKVRSPATAEQNSAVSTASSISSSRAQRLRGAHDNQTKADRPVRAAVKSSSNDPQTNELSNKPTTNRLKTPNSVDTTSSKPSQVLPSKNVRITRATVLTNAKVSQVSSRPNSLQKETSDERNPCDANTNKLRPKSLQAPCCRGPGSLSGTAKRSDGLPGRPTSLREREGLTSVPDRCEKQKERPKSLHTTKVEVGASVLERTSRAERPKSLGASRLTGLQQPRRSTRIDRNTAGGASKTFTNRRSTLTQRNRGYTLGVNRRVSAVEGGNNGKTRVPSKASEPVRAKEKTKALGPFEKTKSSFGAPKLGFSRISQGIRAGNPSLKASKGPEESQIPLSPRRQVRSTGMTKSNDAIKTTRGNSSIPSSPRRLVRSLGPEKSSLNLRPVEPIKNVSNERQLKTPEDVSKEEKSVLGVGNTEAPHSTTDTRQTRVLLVEEAREPKKNAECVDIEALLSSERSMVGTEANAKCNLEYIPVVEPLKKSADDAPAPPAEGKPAASEGVVQAGLGSGVPQPYSKTKDTDCHDGKENRGIEGLELKPVNEGNAELNLQREVKTSTEGSSEQKSSQVSCLELSGNVEKPVQPRRRSAQTAEEVSSQRESTLAPSPRCSNRGKLEPRSKSIQEPVSCKSTTQQSKEEDTAREVRLKGDLSLTSLLNAGNNRVLQWRNKQKIEQQRKMDKENLSKRYQKQNGLADKERGAVTVRELQPWNNAKRNLMPKDTERASAVRRLAAKSTTGMHKGGTALRGLRLRTNGTTAAVTATVSTSNTVKDGGTTRKERLRNVLSERNQQGASKKSFVRLKVNG